MKINIAEKFEKLKKIKTRKIYFPSLWMDSNYGRTNYTTGTHPYSVASGDFNGDGIADLATANGASNTVSILLGTGIGTFGAKADYATGVYPVTVAPGDFNGDGKLDLAVANYEGNTVSILLGTGSGIFGVKTDFATGSYPTSVATGDFNGDGKVDLAVANEYGNTVSILLGTGSGTFGAKTDFATGTNPWSAVIGDFNRDGIADLATANSSDNTVSILLGTGSGTFGAKSDYVTRASPRTVAIGDFNGDDIADLAVANFNGGSVSILLGTGSGTFGAKNDFTTAGSSWTVVIGDFNRDGIADLATANSSDNTVSILLGTGSGTFGAKTDFQTGFSPFAVAVGDFNGDGNADLVTANESSNSVSVLLYTPIHVTATTGTATGNYNTLKAAFDAINAGTHKGNITITVNGNVTETASAVLNASGSGLASYSSVNIYPTVTGLSITGNLATPLIDLNGADNVTIDGRVNATGITKDLTISNTSISSTAGTSTIRLINDASTNTIKYCTLKGSSLAALGTGGIVYLSTGTTTGNNSNTIDNCNITNAGGLRPIQAVSSNGTSTVITNNNFTVSNSFIYDFFNAANSSYGIYASNSNACSVTTNSFYETTAFATSAFVSQYVIYINTGGGNHNISNNYIGGSTNACGGAAMTKTDILSSIFYGIWVDGNATASNIQGNTIKNINWSSIDRFYGMYLKTGLWNIGTTNGNTIGSDTGTGSITFKSGGIFPNFYGIFVDNINFSSLVQNNIIGSITTSNTNANNAAHFRGIWNELSACVYSSNLIGSLTTPNSINASSVSTGSGQSVFGLFGNANGFYNNNTVANMFNACTNSFAQTCGISGSIVNNNIIHDLYGSGGTGTGINASVIGIKGGILSGNGNLIYNLFNSGSNTNVIGIYPLGKTINNVISIGSTASNASFYGIWDQFNYEIYNNSVYIGGNVSSTNNANSSAFVSTGTGVKNYQNNVFVNARSNAAGGTGKNYAVMVSNNTTLTIDYNDYYVSGTGGVFGSYNSVDAVNLAAWKTAVGLDANSINANPLYANPTAVVPDLNLTIGSPCESAGILIADITTDYLGQLRSSFSPTDIGAYAGNFVDTKITSATYNASTGALVVTGTDFVAKAGAVNDIDASMFTITGEGGATYTLTTTPDVERTSATLFTITLNATDKAAVNQIINKNGLNSTNNTAYNLAASANWCANLVGFADLTLNAITVSNVAVPTITNVTYNVSTGVLAVTGTGFLKLSGVTNDIDVTKFNFTGDGANYTLTAATSKVEITNGTTFTVTIAGADKTAVDLRLNKNGTQSIGNVTYNLNAMEDWAAGADAAVNVVSASNGITVSGACSAPTAQATSMTFGTKTSSTIQLNGFTAPSGGASGYAVYVNSVNTFSAPANGTEPVADPSWNAAGQQPIYFGTSTSPTVTVTGLTAVTTYYFKVYAYNDCSGTETYETSGLTGNATTTTPPIHVTATTGTTLGDYGTLKDAFDKINDGTHKGNIVVQVTGSTTETASAVLNASGSGLASYTSVNIYPTVTGLSITGNLATPLIDLNGADNVTIDGRVNATGTIKDLTISNTSTSATAGTSTIRLIRVHP